MPHISPYTFNSTVLHCHFPSPASYSQTLLNAGFPGVRLGNLQCPASTLTWIKQDALRESLSRKRCRLGLIRLSVCLSESSVLSPAQACCPVFPLFPTVPLLSPRVFAAFAKPFWVPVIMQPHCLLITFPQYFNLILLVKVSSLCLC